MRACNFRVFFKDEIIVKFPACALLAFYSIDFENVFLQLNPYTAGVIGWISDSYCSLKPLCSGMGK